MKNDLLTALAGKINGEIIIRIINILLVLLMTVRVEIIDNDKGIAVFIVFYGLLVMMNLTLWLILSLLKSKMRNHMMRMIFWLAVLFIPLLIIIIM